MDVCAMDCRLQSSRGSLGLCIRTEQRKVYVTSVKTAVYVLESTR